MATEVDELIVQISADTRQLRTQLERVRRQTENTFPTGGQSPVARFAGALKGLIGPLVAVGGAMAAVTAVRGIASVADEFEALGITLDRIYDGKGRQAFAEIQRFAQTTPFQLEDTTKAFIQLKSNGIDPSTEMLTIFGDAASAAMNPLEAFNALIRITQRAAGGGLGLEELEQLVNQGLPVYTILQEQLGVSRMEISELGKSAEGAAIIMESLNRGLKQEFGGIMAARMELLSTKVSNAQIALKGLGDEIAKHGLQDFLKGLAEDFESIAVSVQRTLTAMRTGVSSELQGLMLSDDATNEQILEQAESDRRTAADEFAKNVEQAFRSESARAREIAEAGTAAQTEFFDDLLQRFDVEDSLLALEGTARALSDRGIGTFEENMTRALEEQMISLQQIANEHQDSGVNELLNIFITRIADQIRALQAAAKLAEQQGTSFDVSMGTSGTQVSIVTPEDQAAKDAEDAAAEADKRRAREALALSGRIGVLQKQAEKLRDPLIEVDALLDAMETPEFLEAFKDSPEDIELLRSHFQGLKDDLVTEDLLEPYEDLIKLIEQAKDPVKELEGQLVRMKQVFAQGDGAVIAALFGTTDREEIQAIIDAVGDRLTELKTKTEETSDTFAETMAPAIASLAHSFTNDFVAALTSGQAALRAVNAFAKNIVNQIIATFLQMAVVNKIINGVFAGVGGFRPLPEIEVFGGGPRASGGSVGRMRPYLVGERGPELFIPAVAGTIKNAADTRSMSSGGAPIVVNQNLSFSTGVVPTVRAEIAKMLPQISDVTKTSVLEATRRGGNYRRGLLGG